MSGVTRSSGVTREQCFAWMRANRATAAMAAAHFNIKANTVRSWVFRYNGPKYDPPPPVAGVGPASPAAMMSPDDRAELVGLVRRLRGYVAARERKVAVELAEEATDFRIVLDATESGRRLTAQIKSLLDAHPGLMALVETDSSMAGSEAAEQVEAFLGRL